MQPQFKWYPISHITHKDAWQADVLAVRLIVGVVPESNRWGERFPADNVGKWAALVAIPGSYPAIEGTSGPYKDKEEAMDGALTEMVKIFSLYYQEAIRQLMPPEIMRRKELAHVELVALGVIPNKKEKPLLPAAPTTKLDQECTYCGLRYKDHPPSRIDPRGFALCNGTVARPPL